MQTQLEAYIVALLAQGEWERALELIEELGPLPEYAPHLSALVPRLLKDRKAAEAARVAAAAVSLAPESAAAHRAQGIAAEAVGDHAEGLVAFSRAVELDPADASSRFRLTALQLQLGSPHEARASLCEALALAPGEPAARELLKRLRKAMENAAPKSDPVHEELRKLAARLHQGSAAPAAPVSLSLCLIVRNEAENLPRLLRSVRGLAPEIIVVDTGSTDDTVKIARRAGARVELFPWVDDFAAARNHSLSFATGDWVLVMDADDELDRESLPALSAWLQRGSEAKVVGLYRRYPHPEMQRDSVSIQPRLFRNGLGIRFEGAIHEQVVHPDGRPAQPDVTLPVTFHHHGYASGPAAVAARRERNLRILERTVEREPANLRARFYLALTLFEAEAWAEAAGHFRQVITFGEHEDFLPKAHACLANCLLKLNRPLEAERALAEARVLFPEHPEVLFCLGLCLTSLGRLEEAAAAHEAALRGRFGPSLNWHDWACREAKPHMALCDLRLSLGDPEAARAHLEAAKRFTGPRPVYREIAEAIALEVDKRGAEQSARTQELAELETRFAAGDGDAGLRLAEMHLRGDGAERALAFVEAWTEREPDAALPAVARGRILLHLGQPSAGLEQFRRARGITVACVPAWSGEAEALEALGRPDEAEQALHTAHEHSLGAPETARLLGEFYLRRERWPDAANHLRVRIEHADDCWRTRLGLGQALLRTGNLTGAVDCFQRAALLSGGNAAVRAALGEARAFLTSQRPSTQTAVAA